jgi:hypothetical protein
VSAARRDLEPAALELVEEAVHLLRRAPAATLALYYAGTVPFILGLLFYWAHTTWFRPSGDAVAWGALGLVVLFALMKVAQAEFCAHLMALRLGAASPAWSWQRWGRLALAQLRLQPWALVANVIAVNLLVPFGWTFAYSQSLTVIGDDDGLHAAAVAQARLWPRQNHLALLVLGIVALFAWFNVGAAFVTLPMLANRLLGIENIFGFSGAWFLNTTFVASVTALTWLGLDPLVKAFYTLRVFHGRARRTGDDVRVELQLATRGALSRAVAAAVLLLCLWPTASLRSADAPARPAPTAVQPERLNRAIDEVLAGSDFQWRLPPARDPVGKDKAGPITRFLRGGIDWLNDGLRVVRRWWNAVTDWWDRNFTRDKSPQREPTSSGGGGAAAGSLIRLLLYVLIGVAVLLLLWVIWLVIRQARQQMKPVLAAQAVASATPDLRDENVQAAQLPADGWLALARQQAALGEWRLALRALYLATLARLAGEGLISLAKFKTNLDYERELRRRALSRAEIVARFATRRRVFESVWYGAVEPGEADVREWMAELNQ